MSIRNIVMSAAGSSVSIPHSGISFDGLNGNDTAYDVKVDSFENIYISGYTTQPGGSYYSGFILKLGPEGSIKWQRKISSNNSTNVVAESVALDSSGNIYVGSYQLFKYDNNGNVQWIKRISQGYNFRHVATDSSGNVYATCSYDWVTYILKFNSSGTLLWQRSYTTAGYSQALAVDSAGNLVVVGYIYWTGFIIKIDSSGTLLWQRRTQGVDGFSMVRKIGFDSSNNIYVSVWDGYVNPTLRAEVLKISSSGTLIWQRCIDVSSFADTIQHWLTVDSSGNSYVAGYYRYPAVTGIIRTYIAKYNTSGVLQYKRKITNANTSLAVYPLASFVSSQKLYFVGSNSNTSNTDAFIASSSLDGSEWSEETMIVETAGAITFDDPAGTYATPSLTIETGTHIDSIGSLSPRDANLV